VSWVKAASSETETHLGVQTPRAGRRLDRGGVKPSSEAETLPRGHQALERGKDFEVRRLALERGGGSPEGYCGRLFGGLLWLFWAVGPSLLWAATMRSVFCGV
jgi:hypothetical protein